MDEQQRRALADRARELDGRAKALKSQMYRIKEELRDVSRSRDELLARLGIEVTHTQPTRRHGDNSSTTDGIRSAA